MIHEIKKNKFTLWQSSEPVGYIDALKLMEKRVEDISNGVAPSTIWLLHHFPVYTAGKLTQSADIKNIGETPLVQVDRGGKLTFHGPGQLVGYMMIDLSTYHKDVNHFIRSLEQYLISILKDIGLDAFAHPKKIGIWVKKDSTPPQKIASIGIKIRKWVTSHGFALNVNPDLSYFDRITPCGLENDKVTSLQDLSLPLPFSEVMHMASAHLDGFLKTLQAPPTKRL